MAKKIILFILICMITITFLSCSNTAESSDYFIVEIIGNSSDSADTIICSDTASSIYAYLTVLLNDSKDLETSSELITRNLDNINYIAGELLDKQDIPYKAETKITNLERDSRQCGNILIDAGSYKTLLITLGEGKGNTCWSIAYPALTFVEGEDEIILRSKIYEIIKEKKN